MYEQPMLIPYIYYKSTLVTLIPISLTRDVCKALYWCVAYLPSEASIIEH
jgi:hypothetical protein